jgi:hypothetical protein
LLSVKRPKHIGLFSQILFCYELTETVARHIFFSLIPHGIRAPQQFQFCFPYFNCSSSSHCSRELFLYVSCVRTGRSGIFSVFALALQLLYYCTSSAICQVFFRGIFLFPRNSFYRTFSVEFSLYSRTGRHTSPLCIKMNSWKSYPSEVPLYCGFQQYMFEMHEGGNTGI